MALPDINKRPQQRTQTLTRPIANTAKYIDVQNAGAGFNSISKAFGVWAGKLQEEEAAQQKIDASKAVSQFYLDLQEDGDKAWDALKRNDYSGYDIQRYLKVPGVAQLLPQTVSKAMSFGIAQDITKGLQQLGPGEDPQAWANEHLEQQLQGVSDPRITVGLRETVMGLVGKDITKVRTANAKVYNEGQADRFRLFTQDALSRGTPLADMLDQMDVTAASMSGNTLTNRDALKNTLVSELVAMEVGSDPALSDYASSVLNSPIGNSLSLRQSLSDQEYAEKRAAAIKAQSATRTSAYNQAVLDAKTALNLATNESSARNAYITFMNRVNSETGGKATKETLAVLKELNAAVKRIKAGAASGGLSLNQGDVGTPPLNQGSSSAASGSSAAAAEGTPFTFRNMSSAELNKNARDILENAGGGKLPDELWAALAEEGYRFNKGIADQLARRLLDLEVAFNDINQYKTILNNKDKYKRFNLDDLFGTNNATNNSISLLMAFLMNRDTSTKNSYLKARELFEAEIGPGLNLGLQKASSGLLSNLNVDSTETELVDVVLEDSEAREILMDHMGIDVEGSLGSQLRGRVERAAGLVAMQLSNRTGTVDIKSVADGMRLFLRKGGYSTGQTPEGDTIVEESKPRTGVSPMTGKNTTQPPRSLTQEEFKGAQLGTGLGVSAKNNGGYADVTHRVSGRIIPFTLDDGHTVIPWDIARNIVGYAHHMRIPDQDPNKRSPRTVHSFGKSSLRAGSHKLVETVEELEESQAGAALQTDYGVVVTPPQTKTGEAPKIGERVFIDRTGFLSWEYQENGWTLQVNTDKYDRFIDQKKQPVLRNIFSMLGDVVNGFNKNPDQAAVNKQLAELPPSERAAKVLAMLEDETKALTKNLERHPDIQASLAAFDKAPRTEAKPEAKPETPPAKPKSSRKYSFLNRSQIDALSPNVPSKTLAGPVEEPSVTSRKYWFLSKRLVEAMRAVSYTPVTPADEAAPPKVDESEAEFTAALATTFELLGALSEELPATQPAQTEEEEPVVKAIRDTGIVEHLKAFDKLIKGPEAPSAPPAPPAPTAPPAPPAVPGEQDVRPEGMQDSLDAFDNPPETDKVLDGPSFLDSLGKVFGLLKNMVTSPEVVDDVAASELRDDIPSIDDVKVENETEANIAKDMVIRDEAPPSVTEIVDTKPLEKAIDQAIRGSNFIPDKLQTAMAATEAVVKTNPFTRYLPSSQATHIGHTIQSRNNNPFGMDESKKFKTPTDGVQAAAKEFLKRNQGGADTIPELLSKKPESPSQITDTYLDGNARRVLASQGKVVVSLDRNSVGRPVFLRPMIVIPDNSSAEVRKAAHDWVNRTAELVSEKTGKKITGRVLTRGQNKRGRTNTVHLEPYGVDDPTPINGMPATKYWSEGEGAEALGRITMETFGRLEQSLFTSPHGNGDPGAVGPHGSEVDLAKNELEWMRGHLTAGGSSKAVEPPLARSSAITIAKHMGVNPEDKVNLNDPAQLSNFLTGLAEARLGASEASQWKPYIGTVVNGNEIQLPQTGTGEPVTGNGYRLDWPESEDQLHAEGVKDISQLSPQQAENLAAARVGTIMQGMSEWFDGSNIEPFRRKALIQYIYSSPWNDETNKPAFVTPELVDAVYDSNWSKVSQLVARETRVFAIGLNPQQKRVRKNAIKHKRSIIANQIRGI